MWRNKLVLMVYATLLGSLAFCLDSSSLRGAATTAGWIGRLIVGKGVRLASNETEPNNDGQEEGFADDTEGYQSDQTVSRDERKLLHLNPSVHCGDDSMALHVKGTRMPNLMVDRGEEGSIPVSKMPSHCGYSVRRARRDVHIIVPYQGCNVAQQDAEFCLAKYNVYAYSTLTKCLVTTGDDYVLPLRLSSLPLQMSCPAAPFPSVPATALAGPASDPQVLGYPSPPAYPAVPTGYLFPSTPYSAATSPTTIGLASNPQVLGYPPPAYPAVPTGYSSYLVPSTPYSAATSPTTIGLASEPQVLGYPSPSAYPAVPTGYLVPSTPYSVVNSPTTIGLASNPQVLVYPSPPAYPAVPTDYSNYWLQLVSSYPSVAYDPPVLGYPFQSPSLDYTWPSYGRHMRHHDHWDHFTRSEFPSKTADSSPPASSGGKKS